MLQVIFSMNIKQVLKFMYLITQQNQTHKKKTLKLSGEMKGNWVSIGGFSTPFKKNQVNQKLMSIEDFNNITNQVTIIDINIEFCELRTHLISSCTQKIYKN